jgi:formylglycine-generating enzyme required for sulfatase activity
MHRLLLSIVILHSFCVLAAPAADIVALVIGNNAYTRVEDQLDTPINDAELMKRTLEALPGGADVKLLTDATKEEIQIALNALKVRAQGAKLALVFFSGHGMDGQPDGYATEDTFLLPVDATIPDVNYLDTRAISLSSVLTALKNAPVTARAVFLDCCRSGAPKATAALASSTKNFGDIDERVKAALGKAVVPDATLVAFAASPGRKAAAFLTEADENSPFTKFLTDQLATGTGNLRDLVEAAAETTETRTGKRQVPYVTYTGAASAIRQIVFRTSPSQLPVTTPGMTEAEIERRARELAAQMAAEGTGTGAPGTLKREQRTEGSVLDQGAVGKAIQVKLPGDVLIKFAYCPPGSFMMGSPTSEADRSEDEDQVQVRISKGFWMGQTEVTQGQWAAVMGSNPSNFKGNDLPVEMVSWDDAQAFITKLNQSLPLTGGWKYALPTEAQWEYACRAGTESAFHFGDTLNGKEANCDGNNPYGTSTKGPYLEKTVKVGSYAANAWGLYDMHGNVWEWCADSLDFFVPFRVFRGGSWRGNAQNCRAANRTRFTPAIRFNYLGFRVAAVPAGAR